MNHSDKHHSSHIPRPPKTVGLSRRLIWAVGGILSLLIVLFLYFLHLYTPKQAPFSTKPHAIATQDTSDNVSVIEKIESQQHQPLAAHVSVGETTHNVQSTIGSSEANKVFQEGGDASISSYQGHTAPYNSIHHMNLDAQHQGNEGTDPSINASANLYAQQNMQTQKKAFLKATAKPSSTFIHSRLQPSITPYELKAGSIIPATLMTGIQSDLPGQIIAKVRRDVFDTVSGNYLLIPQGTTLIGMYSSQIAYGQSRVLIAWNRLLFPDGTSFNLDGMPGADLKGLAGLHDQVNNHYFRIFGSTLMMSLFGALGQLSQPKNNSNQMTSSQLIYGAIGQQMSQTSIQLLAKNMNIQPTLTIRPGANFNVLLTRDMVLQHPYHQ